MPFTVTTPTSGDWTYTRLQAAVANWLNRSDLTSYIPDFITFAESRLNRELRIREMETSFSLVIPKSINYFPYSEDFTKWSTSGSLSVTSGTTQDPDGNLTGCTVSGFTGASENIYLNMDSDLIIGTEYEFSVYLSGSGTIAMSASSVVTVDGEGTAITLTSDLERHIINVTFGVGSEGNQYLKIITGPTHTATSVNIAWAQLQLSSSIGSYRKTNGTALTETNKIPVPSDYLELKHAYLTTSPQVTLERTSPSALYKRYSTRSATGKPTALARDGDYFVFGPFPDQEYTIEGVYYAKFEALSDTTTYNWLLVNAPEVYLYGALIEAEPFIKNDPRMQMWEQKYQMAINRLQNESDREAFSGQGLRMTAL